MTKKNTTSPLTADIKQLIPNFIRQGTPFSGHMRRFKDDEKEEDDANDDEDVKSKKSGDVKKYTQAELTAALDKARGEERKKLRDELDNLLTGRFTGPILVLSAGLPLDASLVGMITQENLLEFLTLTQLETRMRHRRGG